MLLSPQRAYRVFRTLGLRHLIVVNKRNQVLGMVTRHDLVATHYLSHEVFAEGSADMQSTSSSTSSSSARRRKDKRQQRQRQKRADSINKTIGVELELPTISMDV